MIKSSKISLKFSNIGKKNQISDFLSEYHKVMSCFIDILWTKENIPALLPKEITSQISTWLSARSVQACGKQASSVIKGTKKKQSQAQFIVKKLNKEGKFKQARKLEDIYKKKIAGKPNIESIEAELDSRFVKINLSKGNSFDG